MRDRGISEFALAPLLVGLDVRGRRIECGTFVAPESGQVRLRQLLVDVSELVRVDKKTGIQRVVNSVLFELLAHEPGGYRIEPVYAGLSHGYRYARRFTARFLGLGSGPPYDDPVEVTAGDVFWGLDWQPQIIPLQRNQFASWQQQGVRVIFTVYDLLPLTLPESTYASVSFHHARWLDTIADADGLLAISREVMNNLREWLTLFGGRRSRAVQLGWAHLGANLCTRLRNVPPVADVAFRPGVIHGPLSFLMVGTIEPRKGHAQALDAFERLWAAGLDTRLVIIGKPGWKTESLAARLRGHAEAGHRLFWIEAAGDADLEAAYATSTCLIAASLNEGFGLPLIEAAMRGLPILARDVPVFREVAGEHAAYFSGDDAESLAAAIATWLDRHAAGGVPLPDQIPWLTWVQSVRAMLDCVLHGQWEDIWLPQPEPGLIVRFWGSDPRLDGGAGERTGTRLVSTGRAGLLVAGLCGRLPAGMFEVVILGDVGPGGAGGADALVCACGGGLVLGQIGIVAPHAAVSGILARIPFSLGLARADVEIRIVTNQRSVLSVSMVEIWTAEVAPLNAQISPIAVPPSGPDQQPHGLIS